MDAKHYKLMGCAINIQYNVGTTVSYTTDVGRMQMLPTCAASSLSICFCISLLFTLGIHIMPEFLPLHIRVCTFHWEAKS